MAEKLRSVRRLCLALSVTAVMASACGSPPAATITASSGMATTSTSVTDAASGTLVIGNTNGGSAATASTVPVGVPTTAAVANITVPSRPTSTVPSTTSTTGALAGATGVQGSVLFGPVCPVERIPPDPQCAPRPGAARIRILWSDGVVAAQGTAGVDGRFSIPVAPGSYLVTAAVSTPGPGRGCQVDPSQAAVVTGSLTSVKVTCDTGIR